MTDSGFQLAMRQARAYETQSGVFMGPSAKLIVEALRPRPGDHFLDVACGTGLDHGPGGRDDLVGRREPELRPPGDRLVTSVALFAYAGSEVSVRHPVRMGGWT